MKNVQELLDIMARLRDPENGCPWDQQQTFSSIAPYTIEEAYEVADAIDRGDMVGLKDELADLLFQVVYHARLAEEHGSFKFNDVIAALIEKLVRRHPHVFAKGEFGDARSHARAWEQMKRAQSERGADPPGSLLDGMPKQLPAVLKAAKLQRRAATVGFDWQEPGGVLDKLREELAEFAAAVAGDGDREHEIGDLLFSCINLARHHHIDAEAALRGANNRFERRFRHMERAAAAAGRNLSDLDARELEQLWREAKSDEP
jgi:ATP diphosphatase